MIVSSYSSSVRLSIHGIKMYLRFPKIPWYYSGHPETQAGESDSYMSTLYHNSKENKLVNGGKVRCQ